MSFKFTGEMVRTVFNDVLACYPYKGLVIHDIKEVGAKIYFCITEVESTESYYGFIRKEMSLIRAAKELLAPLVKYRYKEISEPLMEPWKFIDEFVFVRDGRVLLENVKSNKIDISDKHLVSNWTLNQIFSVIVRLEKEHKKDGVES